MNQDEMTKLKEDKIIDKFRTMMEEDSETSVRDLIDILNSTLFYIIAKNNGLKEIEEQLELQFVKVEGFLESEFLPIFTDFNLCMHASKTLNHSTKIFKLTFAEFLYLTYLSLNKMDNFNGLILNPFNNGKANLIIQKPILSKLYNQIKKDKIQCPENSLVPLFHQYIPANLPEISTIFFIPVKKGNQSQKDILLFESPLYYSGFYKDRINQFLKNHDISQYEVMHTGQFEEPLLLSILKVLYERDVQVDNIN